MACCAVCLIPDGRVKSVQLTRKGEQVLRFALPLWLDAQTRMVEFLGDEAWERLRGKLEKLTVEAGR